MKPQAGEFWMSSHGGVVLLERDNSLEHPLIIRGGSSAPCWNNDGECWPDGQTEKHYGRLTHRVDRKGRPIPEKKAVKVDWKRVASRMAKDVRDLLSCGNCGFNENQKSHIGAGLEIYTRSLARERKAK